MSQPLSQQLEQAQNEVILNYFRENAANKSFAEIMGAIDDEWRDTANELIDNVPLATLVAEPKTITTRRPKMTNPQIASELMRWCNGQTEGSSWKMGEITKATGLTAAQVRKGLKLVDGLEKQGEKGNTVYTVCATETEKIAPVSEVA